MRPSPRTSMRALLPLLMLLALLLGATPAHAQITCSSTSMSALNFSSVNPLASQTNITATLSYTCKNSGNRTYSALLCFSIGEPGGGPTSPRLMSSGSNTLQFQMYQDAARTSVWGSQFFGASLTPLQVPITLTKGASTGNRTATLYGQVLGGQASAIPGSYSDVYANGDTALTINDVQSGTAPAACDPTQTGNYFAFTVSATVTKQCTVTAASDVDLGTVPASATNIANNGSISIACSNTTPYTVGLRPSNNSTTGAGLMSAAAGNLDKVPYQLYQNAGMTTLWGNTATATNAGNGVAGTGSGAAKSHTVYVRAPSADFQPDSYSDTVTVVVNY